MARYAKLFSMGGGAGNGTLQLENNQFMDSTLRFVTDNLNTKSVLQLNTRRIGVASDSSVTTQTSSVIQASTTNANLVIAPNGKIGRAHV